MITGYRELQLNLSNLLKYNDSEIDDAVRLTAIDVQNEAVDSIREQSQGRAYTRGTVTHIASKEGDAPNSDTGRLIGSIEVVHNKGQKVARVGTGLDYGAILEIAKSRPWLVPALNKKIDNFGKNVIKATRKAMAKAAR